MQDDTEERMAAAILAAKYSPEDWPDGPGGSAVRMAIHQAAAAWAVVSPVLDRLRAELAEAQRRMGHYKAALEMVQRARQRLSDELYASCICDPNPETTEGPLRECPVHGDDEHRPLALAERAEQAEVALTRCQDVKRIVAAERDALKAAANELLGQRAVLLAAIDGAREIAATAGRTGDRITIALALPPMPIPPVLDTPSAPDCRRPLDALTAEAIDAGSYGEPAPQMRPDTPASATETTEETDHG